jgi:hypothetical protein
MYFSYMTSSWKQSERTDKIYSGIICNFSKILEYHTNIQTLVLYRMVMNKGHLKLKAY